MSDLELDELRFPGRFTVKCINRACGLPASARFEAQRGKIQIRVAGETAAPWQDVIFVSVPTHDGLRINEIPYSPDWFAPAKGKARSDTKARTEFPAAKRHKDWSGTWDRKAASSPATRAARPAAPSNRGRKAKRKSKRR